MEETKEQKMASEMNMLNMNPDLNKQQKQEEKPLNIALTGGTLETKSDTRYERQKMESETSDLPNFELGDIDVTEILRSANNKNAIETCISA